MYPLLSVAQLLAQASFAVTAARGIETVLAASCPHVAHRCSTGPGPPTHAAPVAPLCALAHELNVGGDPLMLVAAAVQFAASVTALVLAHAVRPRRVTVPASDATPK